jgi:hypothetical protein
MAVSAMATTRFTSSGPSSATTISPRISEGKESRHVHDLHDEQVEPPADIAGDEADRRADDHRAAMAPSETVSEICPPHISPDRMSRPNWSVPRR